MFWRRARLWKSSWGLPFSQKCVEQGDPDEEQEASERLGTTVEIRPGKKGTGKLVLHYASLDHLDRLLRKLR